MMPVMAMANVRKVFAALHDRPGGHAGPLSTDHASHHTPHHSPALRLPRVAGNGIRGRTHEHVIRARAAPPGSRRERGREARDHARKSRAWAGARGARRGAARAKCGRANCARGASH
jgi:hypothetical protein